MRRGWCRRCEIMAIEARCFICGADLEDADLYYQEREKANSR